MSKAGAESAYVCEFVALFVVSKCVSLFYGVLP